MVENYFNLHIVFQVKLNLSQSVVVVVLFIDIYLRLGDI